MVHDHVRNSRKDDIEQKYSDQPLGVIQKLANYLPPCSRDANTFGAEHYIIRHDDPLDQRALPSVEEELPPYSCCPTPYRWMLEENFDDICADENLQISGRKK